MKVLVTHEISKLVRESVIHREREKGVFILSHMKDKLQYKAMQGNCFPSRRGDSQNSAIYIRFGIRCISCLLIAASRQPTGQAKLAHSSLV